MSESIINGLASASMKGRYRGFIALIASSVERLRHNSSARDRGEGGALVSRSSSGFLLVPLRDRPERGAHRCPRIEKGAAIDQGLGCLAVRAACLSSFSGAHQVAFVAVGMICRLLSLP